MTNPKSARPRLSLTRPQRDAKDFDRETQLINRQSENLLRNSDPSPWFLRWLTPREQRECREVLKRDIVETTVVVQQGVSQEAARTAKLAVEYAFQVARSQALIEHRNNLDHIQVEAQNALKDSLIQLLEQKSAQQAATDSHTSDAGLADEANRAIQDLYIAESENLVIHNNEQ